MSQDAMSLEITVEQLFEGEKITQQQVVDVADVSEYWAKASKFIFEVWSKKLDDLSDPQSMWLMRLHEDMTEMRIEGKL